MTESVLSAVARFLTPEIVGKMATASGLDRFVAQKAVDASVPAILGGLSHLASQPGGARQLGNAIAEQPAGILGSLASALGGSAQLADQGNNLLSSLLGGGVLGSIASGVSKYVGIGEGSARTLMGLLSPVIMGILGRQQRAAGLDASEFARMLAGQKDELAAAIPTGLADLLPRDLHETFDTPRSAEGRAYDFPRAAYNAPRTSNGATQRMVSEPKVEIRTGELALLAIAAAGARRVALVPAAHRPCEPAGVRAYAYNNIAAGVAARSATGCGDQAPVSG